MLILKFQIKNHFSDLSVKVAVIGVGMITMKQDMDALEYPGVNVIKMFVFFITDAPVCPWQAFSAPSYVR